MEIDETALLLIADRLGLMRAVNHARNCVKIGIPYNYVEPMQSFYYKLM